MHRSDSKYYLKFFALSGPRLSDSKISDTVNIIRKTKIVLGRHFGGFCVEKIQLFGFSFVPCHFILHIICTSHFLDKCTISHKRNFLSQSPRQKSRILKQFFSENCEFFPFCLVSTLETASVWKLTTISSMKPSYFLFTTTSSFYSCIFVLD